MKWDVIPSPLPSPARGEGGVSLLSPLLGKRRVGVTHSQNPLLSLTLL